MNNISLSFILARPTTPATYTFKGGLLTTGIAGGVCVLGVIAAVVRRLRMSSNRNSLSKTMSSATARTPLSKSTGSLSGTDDTSELKETCEREDSAGFESRATCIIGSRASIFDDLSDCGKSSSKSPVKEEVQLTTQGSVNSQADSNVSEHQLMLPKSKETFLTQRESPDGKKEEMFRDYISPVRDFTPYVQDSEGWSDMVSEELLKSRDSSSGLPFR